MARAIPKKAVSKAKKAKSPRSLSTMPKYYPEINDRIKSVRTMQGLTAAQFSKEIGITPELTRQMETHRCNPNIYILRNIHKRFGVRYEWLLDGK